ncbi:hypothetical protein GCM10027443_36010 [Pontibacter brevis]
MKQTKTIVTETEKAVDAKAEDIVHKERFLEALSHNHANLDEEELGLSIGFSKEYTYKIIEELMREGKITHHTTGTCRYKPTKEKLNR